MGQEDLSERGKAREIEKLYAKARAGKGAKKGKPSRSAAYTSKKKGKPLDGRLRADQRQASGFSYSFIPFQIHFRILRYKLAEPDMAGKTEGMTLDGCLYADKRQFWLFLSSWLKIDRA